MSEYLTPGVYVEEVALNSKPIDGVSTSTASFIGHETVAKLRGLTSDSRTHWREDTSHDPGVALLELFAWLTEQLLARVGPVPDAAISNAARLAAAALTLIADREAPANSVLQRTRFLPGKHLDREGCILGPSTSTNETNEHSHARVVRRPHDPA
jgi:phage tail sheath protein FI